MAEFWIGVEIMTDKNGKHTTRATPFDDYDKAQSLYYGALSNAAISTNPYHAAVLLSSKTGFDMMKIFEHKEG